MLAESRSGDEVFEPGLIVVPPDFERSPVQRFRRDRAEHRHGPDYSVAESESALIGLTALCVLLHRWSQQRAVPLGLLVARDGEVTAMPMHVVVPPGIMVGDFAIEVDTAATVTTKERAEYDFDRAVAELGAESAFDRNPLFQIAYAGTQSLSKTEAEDAFDAVANCDLVFAHDPATATLRCEFDADLFRPETVERLLAQWAVLVESLAVQRDTPVAELDFRSSSDRELVAQWSAGPQVPRPDTTLHALIAERARSRPGAPALTAEGATFSYAELDRAADRVAGYLGGLGVRSGQIVALCLPRSRRVPILALGVLKAGAAFLPLDPADPDARLRGILADAGVRVVLCDSAAEARRLDGLPDTLAVDLDHDAEAIETARPLPKQDGAATDLAYIIYTSGSTGRPKGVLVEHGAICNRLMHDEIRVGVGDSVLQKTPLTFDVAVWDTFYPLVHGARLVLTGPDGHRDSRHLLETIRAEEITAVHFVPSMLRTWLAEPGVEDCESLRYVTASGEELTADVVEEFRRRLPDVALYNYYGPTEAAVDVTWWRADTGRLGGGVPIGRPLENIRIQVLDDANNEVPVGVPGELYVSGAGLARGYVDSDDERGRFGIDPETGARRYATGDRVRWLADGLLEYLGRRDRQLKLRGVRIEAGEIEAALRACPGVREAVATVRGADAQHAELIGYVAADPQRQRPEAAALREALRATLPGYLVPNRIVVLDDLPHTASGKLDRAGLPEPSDPVEVDAEQPDTDDREIPAAAQTATAVIESRDTATDLETATRPSPRPDGIAATIAAAWSEVLNRDTVPRTANFFDLGGNSLLLARVHRLLEQRLPVPVNRTDLFRYPTVSTLAAALATRTPVVADPVTPVPEVESSTDDGYFAVVGMACRVPGADDPEEFWDIVAGARTTMTALTEDELRAAGESPERLAAPGYVRSGAVLDDIAGFDAEFFGYTAREAQVTDPQQRLLLEVAYEALEYAGYGAAQHRPRTGVFVGGLPSSYFHRYFADEFTRLPSTVHYQIKVGNEPDFLPTTIAYRLDLRGPAMTVQTACSTSLVAIHLACAAIARGECDMALAGGVAVRVPDRVGYLHQDGMVASPDGHCRAFDESAAGTVFGNGAGVVVLKRLTDAVRSGDQIVAVLRGSAINNDGSEKVGFTAPGVAGQVEVVRRAQQNAGVTPDEIGYVEAHGTGTPIGDPMEIEALTEAFGTGPGTSCAIGSVKANIGHLDTAAGVVGFIRAALAVQHGILPGQADLVAPSSRIPWAETPFEVHPESRPWPVDRPRVAAVSAFGIGGTNAHAVLAAPPARTERTTPPGWVGLFRLSAQTPAALRDLAGRYLDFLDRNSEARLEDICYTVAVGRAHHSHRLAVVTDSVDELRSALAAFVAGSRARALFTAAGSDDLPVLLAIGNGPVPALAEFVDGAAADPVVAAARDHALAAAQLDAGGRLADLPAADRDRAARHAFAELLTGTGIDPAAVIGYGSGAEVAAALDGAADRPLWPVPDIDDTTDVDAVERTLRAAIGTGGGRILLLDGESDLRARVRQVAATAGAEVILAAGGPHELWHGLCIAIAKLYVTGAEVCREPWGPFAVGSRIPLPTYAFQRSRHWVDSARRPAAATAVEDAFVLPGTPVELPLSDEIRYLSEFRCDRPGYVNDHRLFGTAVVPGASHIAMVLAAGARQFDGPFALRDTLFLNPFAVSDDGSRRAQLVLRPAARPGWDVTLVAEAEHAAQSGAEWVSLFRTGLESAVVEPDSALSEEERTAIRERCPDELPGTSFYRDVWVPGLDTGNSFHWIETVWRGDNEALCLARRPADVEVGPEPLHPGLVEAAFQVLNSCWKYDNEQLRASENIYVPFSIDRYYCRGRRSEGPLWIHARLAGGHTAGDEAFTAHIRMYDTAGELVVAVDGFESRRIDRARVERILARTRADVTHEQRWQRADLVDTPPERVAVAVLDDDPLRLRRCAGTLRRAGIEVISVLADATDPGRGETGVRTVDPGSTAAVAAVLAELPKVGSRGLVDLRGLTGSPESAEIDVQLPIAAERGASAVVPVTAAASAGVRLWWPTTGSQPVTAPTDVTNPFAALYWGVAAVVRREFPEVHCATVDLDDDGDASLERLAAEIRAWSPEPRVAHRGGDRYIARLRRAEAGTPIDIRGDRTYLVTGGLRGIGRRVAQWLAAAGARHLTLVGRGASETEAAELTAELAELGARVRLVAADLGTADGIDRVAAAVAAESQPLGGIVHAAGALDDGTLATLTAPRFARALAPKLGGATAIRRLLDSGPDVAVDFVALFSSVTATVGTGGQANYAAANAYLDAVAAQLRASGTTATSIAWGPWGEIGMAARLGGEDRTRARDRGFHDLTPDQGIRLLADNLAASGPTVIAADIDWPKLAASAGYTGDPWFGVPAAATAPASGAVLRERVVAALRGERPDLVRTLVDGEVKAVLGLGAGHLVDPDEGFTSLGMDSLAVVELRARLQDGFGVALPATFGFDHPTVTDAADHLLGLLTDEETESAADPGPERPDTPIVAHRALARVGGAHSTATESAHPVEHDAPHSDSIEAELALLEAELREEGER